MLRRFHTEGSVSGMPANAQPDTLYTWVIARVSSGGFDTSRPPLTPRLLPRIRAADCGLDQGNEEMTCTGIRPCLFWLDGRELVSLFHR